MFLKNLESHIIIFNSQMSLGFFAILSAVNFIISHSSSCISEDNSIKCMLKYDKNEFNISLKIDDRYVKQLSFINKYINQSIYNIENMTFKNITDVLKNYKNIK